MNDNFLQQIRTHFGELAKNDETTLNLYRKKFSYHQNAVPDVIVYPKSEEDVVWITQFCNSNKIPIVAYGNGTSLEGHTIPVKGGVCLNFENMDKIIALNKADLDVIVQPGVSFMELNRALNKESLWFPLDAGPNATIGGMVNTNASGTKAVRYGSMRDNVLSLHVVLADGSLVNTGNRARKTSAGYDLTHLFVGSEGTLGIVTRITLRIRRIPNVVVAALTNFPTISDASNAVMEMIQQDITIGMVEMLDELMIRATNLHFDMKLEEKPTLYLEFNGVTDLALDEQVSIVRTICLRHGGSSFIIAKSEKERVDLWRTRKAALLASRSLRPNADIWTTDVCVPISKLADCIVATKADLAKSFLLAPLVGHVGDGNFHLFILFDSKNPKEVEEAKRINSALVHRALSFDGTCSGEHGVGLGKTSYLESELGSPAVELMRILKRTLDPNNILNPGKVLPEKQAKL